ncbi:MAG: hypothetical protein WHV44_09200 [Anaerolineales bacterium]
MNLSPLRALARHPHLPILLLVGFNLLVGLVTFRAYGMSWDEPLFYQYADAIPGAYSISARLDGTFVLEEAYGPSSDHGRYGPAYLLLARWPVLALRTWAGLDPATAWHLVNFITFQLSVLVFYLLLRRWVSPLAALGSAALFAWQPVLWGHAFMNPKDMPFMAFFIFSVYAGLRLVDAARIESPLPDLSPRHWRRMTSALIILCAAAGLLTLALLLFPDPIAQLAQDTLTLAYTDPSSLPGMVFSLLTVNARNAPLAVYQVKLDRLLSHAAAMSGVAALMLGGLTLLTHSARPALEHARRWLHLNVPLPGLLMAALLVGLTTSIRILGPLAGIIVALAMLFRWRQRAIAPLLLYGLVAFAACYATWPYLWGGPVDQFLSVLARNTNNPERVRMLFDGQITYSDEIPLTYMPTMLAWTLTEPTWPLALAGLMSATFQINKKRLDWHTYLPATLWLAAPLVYIALGRPPLYDGFRHFTFMIPGIFILAAPALEAVFARLKKASLRAGVLILLLAPALIGYAQLYPYEYAYYNAFAGGTRGVFRNYETEYWLTCYKEAFSYINTAANGPVFVQRNLRLAQYYAQDGLDVRFIPENEPLPSGSLVLQTTRTNGDQLALPDLPVVYQVARQGAVFCVVKQVP